ncbi:MAG TPA: ATP-binding protein [Gaiellaceae bacterium]|nr:ATP-binding protein [Gaiellaceae bacterium]
MRIRPRRLPQQVELRLLAVALVLIPVLWFLHGLFQGDRVELAGSSVAFVFACALAGRLLKVGRALVRALDEARRSEEKFRLVFESAGVGISLGRGGLMTETNPAYQRMLGYSAEELAQMHYLDVTHPDDRGADLEISDRVMSGELPMCTFEKRYLTRSGEERWASVTLTLSSDKSFGIAMTEDTTEWHRLQAALDEAKRVEAIGRLAGGIAHDFNNLLTAVGGYARLLRVDERDETRRLWLDSILDASSRAAELTHQLLAYSGRQVLRPEPLDLAEIVVSTEQMLRRLVPGDVRLLVSAEEGAVVTVDRAQMEEVVLNLVLNARDALGGAGTIELSVVRGDGEALLTVRDDGAGMTEEQRRSAFEPFYTTKEIGEGSGLGLSTVRGIVRQSGGVIEVDSEPGCGSTFTIRLPLTAAEPAAAEPTAAASREQANGTTVLLVEDTDVVRAVTRDLLVSHGYRVLEADGADTALRHLVPGAAPVDVLVSDLVLPGRNGVQVANAARAIRPGLPVVFVSGYPRETLAQRDVPLGTEVLPKPFSGDELAERIESVLASAARPLPAAAASR